MRAGADRVKVVVLGAGGIGRRIVAMLQAWRDVDVELAVFCRPASADRLRAELAVRIITDTDELLGWHPDLAVECAGHEVVANLVPALLGGGTDVILASIGALADDELRRRLKVHCGTGRSRLRLVAGAIGGLDALSAARLAGLDEVRYVGRKPPRAWLGSPAQSQVDLNSLVAPVVIFEGNAGEAARTYPNNANVAAAVALAGIGFSDTQVRLIADPGVTMNVHEIFASGASGQFEITLKNCPLPDNPKTSWLAALSLESELADYFGFNSSNL